MIALQRSCRALFFLAALVPAAAVSAQPSASAPASTVAAVAPRPAPQGVAVLSLGGARDEAFTLARAVYASSLRPRTLDELRARILAGDPAPSAASRDVRELAELRASIAGDDATSRRLLASIAREVGVQALLVVSTTTDADAGVSIALDAGAPAHGPPTGTPTVVARLFLTEEGEFDAARYEPDASDGWRGTVSSLARRFPPPPTPAAGQTAAPPPRISSEGKESKPFYTSPWLWGALGAAVLIGGFFFFASQDTGDEPIHLQMKVPR